MTAHIDVQTANFAVGLAITCMRQFEGKKMKKVFFAVLLTALALFLILPNLSWAH
jgi:hypothetical protein